MRASLNFCPSAGCLPQNASDLCRFRFLDCANQVSRKFACQHWVFREVLKIASAERVAHNVDARCQDDVDTVGFASSAMHLPCSAAALTSQVAARAVVEGKHVQNERLPSSVMSLVEEDATGSPWLSYSVFTSCDVTGLMRTPTGPSAKFIDGIPSVGIS